MRDNKHIIKISGMKYAVQRTFSNDPAIYISIGKDDFVHISDLNKNDQYHTRIESICSGMESDDDIIIFAHLVESIGNELFCFSIDKKIIIDGKEYYIDLNCDNQPAIYMATKCRGGIVLYHLSEYIGYTRTVKSPRHILHYMGDGINQVIIRANMLDISRLNMTNSRIADRKGDEFTLYCTECGYPTVKDVGGLITCPNSHCNNKNIMWTYDRRQMIDKGFIYGINFKGKKATCHIVVPSPRIDDTSIRFTGKNYCEHCGKEISLEEGKFCRKCSDDEEFEFKYCHNCGSDRINVYRVFDSIHRECNYEYNCKACGYYPD